VPSAVISWPELITLNSRANSLLWDCAGLKFELRRGDPKSAIPLSAPVLAYSSCAATVPIRGSTVGRASPTDRVVGYIAFPAMNCYR
jgi:hypothetical protein